MEREFIMSGEFEAMPKNIEVTLLAENGLGFGEGSISAERPDVTPEMWAKAKEVIADQSQILVDVSRDDNDQVLDDDGCGDGRHTDLVFDKDQTYKQSLHRAKVFGAGPAMESATMIGMGAPSRNLLTVFKSGIKRLKDRFINFGGHTDGHAHGPNCGCGALDKAPQIIHNTVKYKTEIHGVMTEVLGFDDTLVSGIQDNFEHFDSVMDTTDYSGRAVMDEVIGSGKVVKRLAGDHKEGFVIINFVRGKTVNQAAVREATDGTLDPFVIDAWRLEDIAERSYDTPEDQASAYAAMMVYTLGTSGTLTKGDLPVYVIKEQAQTSNTPEPALAA